MTHRSQSAAMGKLADVSPPFLTVALTPLEANFVLTFPWLFSTATVAAARGIADPTTAYPQPPAPDIHPAAPSFATSTLPAPVTPAEAYGAVSQSIADAETRTQAQEQQFFTDLDTANTAAVSNLDLSSTTKWFLIGGAAVAALLILTRRS